MRLPLAYSALYLIPWGNINYVFLSDSLARVNELAEDLRGTCPDFYSKPVPGHWEPGAKQDLQITPPFKKQFAI